MPHTKYSYNNKQQQLGQRRRRTRSLILIKFTALFACQAKTSDYHRAQDKQEAQAAKACHILWPSSSCSCCCCKNSKRISYATTGNTRRRRSRTATRAKPAPYYCVGHISIARDHGCPQALSTHPLIATLLYGVDSPLTKK